MVRRLARRTRSAQDEGLPIEETSPETPAEAAGPGTDKKSPGLGPLSRILQAWTEAKPGTPRTVAQEVAQLYGHLQPWQLRPEHFLAILENWRHHHKRSTAREKRTVFARLLRHLAACGCTAAQVSLPRVARSQVRAVVATTAELAALFHHAQPWLRLFILLCTQLGLRYAEAMRVSPTSWNRGDRTITVSTKGGKLRTIPTTVAIEEILAAAQPAPGEEHESCVRILKGKRYGAKLSPQHWTVHHHWKKLKEAARVNPDLTIHDLRRTAATMLYRSTLDVLAVQQFLGHADLKATSAYLAPFAPTRMRELIEQLKLPTEVKQ